MEPVLGSFVVLISRKPAKVSELEERKAIVPTYMREAPEVKLGIGRIRPMKLERRELVGVQLVCSGRSNENPKRLTKTIGLDSEEHVLRLSSINVICGQNEPRWMSMDYLGSNVLNSTHNEVQRRGVMADSLNRCDPTKENMEETIHGPSCSGAMFNQKTSLALYALR